MYELCKGGCGNKATYKGWCKIKWKSGNKFCVACPVIEEKRRKSISRYRIQEAKLGKNPMQNPEICKKNHSPERNKKAAATLKKLGKLGLLPQQTESKELKDKRRKNVSKTLRKMYKEGIHPIIEVKGNGEIRSIKTKDKINSLKKAGFRILLFGRKEIEKIRGQNYSDLNSLLGVPNEKS